MANLVLMGSEDLDFRQSFIFILSRYEPQSEYDLSLKSCYYYALQKQNSTLAIDLCVDDLAIPYGGVFAEIRLGWGNMTHKSAECKPKQLHTCILCGTRLKMSYIYNSYLVIAFHLGICLYRKFSRKWVDRAYPVSRLPCRRIFGYLLT